MHKQLYIHMSKSIFYHILNNSFLTVLHEDEKEQLILTRVDLELCIISTVSLAWWQVNDNSTEHLAKIESLTYSWWKIVCLYFCYSSLACSWFLEIDFIHNIGDYTCMWASLCATEAFLKQLSSYWYISSSICPNE